MECACCVFQVFQSDSRDIAADYGSLHNRQHDPAIIAIFRTIAVGVCSRELHRTPKESGSGTVPGLYQRLCSITSPALTLYILRDTALIVIKLELHNRSTSLLLTASCPQQQRSSRASQPISPSLRLHLTSSRYSNHKFRRSNVTNVSFTFALRGSVDPTFTSGSTATSATAL